jgi:hypothetical protein
MPALVAGIYVFDGGRLREAIDIQFGLALF